MSLLTTQYCTYSIALDTRNHNILSHVFSTLLTDRFLEESTLFSSCLRVEGKKGKKEKKGHISTPIHTDPSPLLRFFMTLSQALPMDSLGIFSDRGLRMVGGLLLG